MIYRRNSVDYEINLEALHEMEEFVPMTLNERNRLRGWVKAGHDIDSNPWHYLEDNGAEMNFLKAFRILYGSSHGPWDSWEFDTYSLPAPDASYANFQKIL